jgi:hypothetical protein
MKECIGPILLEVNKIQNAIVVGGMNIMKGVQGSLHMSSRRFIAEEARKE